jgi:hypothetical protein
MIEGECSRRFIQEAFAAELDEMMKREDLRYSYSGGHFDQSVWNLCRF